MDVYALITLLIAILYGIPHVIFLNMGCPPCEQSALWVLSISPISYHNIFGKW